MFDGRSQSPKLTGLHLVLFDGLIKEPPPANHRPFIIIIMILLSCLPVQRNDIYVVLVCWINAIVILRISATDGGG